MAIHIPADEMELGFVHTQTGTTELAVCTLGIRGTGPITGTQFLAAANAWVEEVLPVICSTIRLVEVHGRTNEGTSNVATFSVPGGLNVDCAPYSVATLVHKISGVPGRRNRGRWYLPGVNEDAVDAAGVISPAIYAPFQARMDAFQEALDDANLKGVIFHNPPLGGGTPASTEILSFQVDARVATQRGRLRR